MHFYDYLMCKRVRREYDGWQREEAARWTRRTCSWPGCEGADVVPTLGVQQWEPLSPPVDLAAPRGAGLGRPFCVATCPLPLNHIFFSDRFTLRSASQQPCQILMIRNFSWTAKLKFTRVCSQYFHAHVTMEFKYYSTTLNNKFSCLCLRALCLTKNRTLSRLINNMLRINALLKI